VSFNRHSRKFPRRCGFNGSRSFNTPIFYGFPFRWGIKLPQKSAFSTVPSKVTIPAVLPKCEGSHIWCAALVTVAAISDVWWFGHESSILLHVYANFDGTNCHGGCSIRSGDYQLWNWHVDNNLVYFSMSRIKLTQKVVDYTFMEFFGRVGLGTRNSRLNFEAIYVDLYFTNNMVVTIIKQQP